MSYLERDALGRDLEGRIEAATKAKDSRAATMFATMRMIVAMFPSAPARPITHGKWLDANDRPRSWQFKCSACDQIAYAPQPTRSPTWQKGCPYAFCPYCGAEMEPADG